MTAAAVYDGPVRPVRPDRSVDRASNTPMSMTRLLDFSPGCVTGLYPLLEPTTQQKRCQAEHNVQLAVDTARRRRLAGHAGSAEARPVLAHESILSRSPARAAQAVTSGTMLDEPRNQLDHQVDIRGGDVCPGGEGEHPRRDLVGDVEAGEMAWLLS